MQKSLRIPTRVIGAKAMLRPSLMLLVLASFLTMAILTAAPAYAMQENDDVGASIVAQAKKIAANPLVGYSFSSGDEGHEKDLVCYSFVDEVLLAVFPDYDVPQDNRMSGQKRELEKLGFTRHEFIGYDDPNLVPGSIIYNSHTSHVELYAGCYSTHKADLFDNPMPDPDGRPVTIGGRAKDRMTSALSYPHDAEMYDFLSDNCSDPGLAGGDQYQKLPGRWWGGEVSGGWADFRNASNGYWDGYWGYYYAPPISR